MESLEKNSILIVDDETSHILNLNYILGADCEIYTAKDGETAIKIANEYLPDLILLDVIMPDMDGYQVLTALKESDKTKDIPVIFITGANDHESEMKGLAYGADDYITKPFNDEIVRLRVKILLKTINQNASERIKALLDSTPMACRLWNRDHQIFECNEEALRLFGLGTKQELTDRYFDFSPEYQPDGQYSRTKKINMLEKVLTTGRESFEWLYTLPDGTEIPCEVTLIRVKYDNDYVIAGYSRDLREQKQMMREIQETSVKLEVALRDAQNANNAKSDFLAKISHEMRTPLNAVIGLSELILDSGGTDEEDRSNLEKIYNAGVALLSTVNDVLDISKIEAGRLVFVEVDYDVPSLINDSVTENILRIGDKPIKFVLDVGEDMFARLIGDELKVKQVMNNLLSNAIKYTEEGEVVLSIHCTREHNIVWLDITVSDTGRGVKPENIDRLFLDYMQLDTESNRYVEGTGLGLSITKRLAEMMGGSVTVESKYGEGSVFTVRLAQKYVTGAHIGPAVVDNLKSFRYSDSRRERDARRVRISLPYAHVLVVDDNLTNLDVAKGLMKPYGMRIDCVTSGQDAIDAMQSEEVRYNAIFMDHMMPDMDGIEAMQKIRAIDSEYARNIPVIALTANAIAGNEEMFISKGFQAFLSKPIDIPRLDEVIRHWVRDKEQEKMLEEGQDKPESWRDKPGLWQGNQEHWQGDPEHWQDDPEYWQDKRVLSDRRSGIDRRKVKMVLAGLDIVKGIEKFGGDEETYLDILRSYAVNTRPLLESIEDVTEDKLAGYAVVVHGIKGSSRGIYADMIGASAERLEKAARAGDLVYVKQHNKTFLAAVKKFISDLESMLSDAAVKDPKPVRDRPDDILLSKLLAACISYDIDNVDELMEEIMKFEYTQDAGLAEWLNENAKLSNLKAIINKLSL